MTTITSPTTRCRRCRRVLRDPAWIACGLGRVCAERLGLQRKRKPKARRPRVGDVPEQPSLLDLLDELDTEEIDESEE